MARELGRGIRKLNFFAGDDGALTGAGLQRGGHPYCIGRLIKEKDYFACGEGIKSSDYKKLEL